MGCLVYLIDLCKTLVQKAITWCQTITVPRRDLVTLNQAGLVRSHSSSNVHGCAGRGGPWRDAPSLQRCSDPRGFFFPIPLQFLAWSFTTCQLLVGSRSGVGASRGHHGNAADTLPGVPPLSLQEGDSLGAMEKLCRQLTYHLSPHSQWRRQGIMKRKPQSW